MCGGVFRWYSFGMVVVASQYRISRLPALTLGIWLSLLPAVAHADTHYVSLSGNHVPPFSSWADASRDIQPAVDAADDGDRVIVNSGTYYLAAEVSVTRGVTIEGLNGAGSTIVDGNNAARCFFLDHDDVVLDGLTIRNGVSDEGGGVYARRSRAIRNCTISGNTARLILEWDSVSGRLYTVYAASNLLGIAGWSNVLDLVGDGGAASYTNALPVPRAALRVGVRQPD